MTHSVGENGPECDHGQTRQSTQKLYIRVTEATAAVFLGGIPSGCAGTDLYRPDGHAVESPSGAGVYLMADYGFKPTNLSALTSPG